MVIHGNLGLLDGLLVSFQVLTNLVIDREVEGANAGACLLVKLIAQLHVLRLFLGIQALECLALNQLLYLVERGFHFLFKGITDAVEHGSPVDFSFQHFEVEGIESLFLLSLQEPALFCVNLLGYLIVVLLLDGIPLLLNGAKLLQVVTHILQLLFVQLTLVTLTLGSELLIAGFKYLLLLGGQRNALPASLACRGIKEANGLVLRVSLVFLLGQLKGFLLPFLGLLLNLAFLLFKLHLTLCSLPLRVVLDSGHLSIGNGILQLQPLLCQLLLNLQLRLHLLGTSLSGFLCFALGFFVVLTATATGLILQIGFLILIKELLQVVVAKYGRANQGPLMNAPQVFLNVLKANVVVENPL